MPTRYGMAAYLRWLLWSIVHKIESSLITCLISWRFNSFNVDEKEESTCQWEVLKRMKHMDRTTHYEGRTHKQEFRVNYSERSYPPNNYSRWNCIYPARCLDVLTCIPIPNTDITSSLHMQWTVYWDTQGNIVAARRNGSEKMVTSV